MNKYIAEYLRLSDDDDSTGESSSIISQRQIIESYISLCPDLANMTIKEFSDDGYSGTNFDRPGIRRLLEAVRRGEVGCIIVKDLSRFGRKYLEVSKFIEQLFPYLGVRFIAVNDHYDSDSHKGTSAEIDIAIRNMINAMYSKDISKKVKSAKNTLVKQGIYIDAFASYGYKKDISDIHRIVIDEPAAAVVKHIYEYAIKGYGPSKIASILNSEGVLTPSEYKRQNGSRFHSNGITKSLWSVGTVTKILRNEQYTGIFIAGRTEAGELGFGKKLSKPKNDWIRIPNVLPVIITPEIWNTVIALRRKNESHHSQQDKNRILYKKVLCGYCGHVMRYRGEAKSPNYSCRSLRENSEHDCLYDKYPEQVIVDVVKTTIKSQISLLFQTEKLLRGIKNKNKQDMSSSKNISEQLEKEIRQLQSSKRQIYEQYKNGEIEKSEYLNEREKIEHELSSKTAEQENLRNICDKQDRHINTVLQFLEQFEQLPSGSDLTPEMVNKLVKSVHIFGRDRFEIEFTFRDELDNALYILDALQQDLDKNI